MKRGKNIGRMLLLTSAFAASLLAVMLVVVDGIYQSPALAGEDRVAIQYFMTAVDRNGGYMGQGHGFSECNVEQVIYRWVTKYPQTAKVTITVTVPELFKSVSADPCEVEPTPPTLRPPPAPGKGG